MSGKQYSIATGIALLVIALLVIAFHLGKGWNGGTPEAVQEVIQERLQPLKAMEERLRRLEEEVGSLRGAPSGDAPEGSGEPARDENSRLAAIESSLSTLKRRVKGLEQDPLSRGYSFLESENAEMRREGINLLTRVARFDPETRAAFRELLDDPSPRVREQAAQKLRDLRDKESAPKMMALLADPDSRTRRRAVQALGAMDARNALRDIGRTLVSDGDDRVRVAAAEVLKRMKTREAEEFFTEALKDRNESVRGLAITSLGEIGATTAAPRLRALYDQEPGKHRLRLVMALESLGDQVPLQKEVSRLTQLVKTDRDDRVRQQAIRELSVIARDSSQEVFSGALQDSSPRVRQEAERALR